MKAKCPECGTGKARRNCRRAGDVEICSACCAAMRDADCGDCIHYATTLQYEESRSLSASDRSAGHYMMEISPDVSDAVNEALETAGRGGFKSAMESLTDLLRDHPLHHDVPYGIGVVHAMKGEHEEAIRWFDRAIGIDPNRVESQYNKAVAYQKLLDVPNCIRAYQKVVAIGPANDPEVAHARSFVEEMATAIQRNEGVTLKDFLRASDMFNEAFELMEGGDWQGALKGFRASAAVHDMSAPCHGNIGLCLANLGRKAEALAELDRALEINPKYQPAQSNRKVAEQMEEGKPLENTRFESINFSRTNVLKRRK